MANNDDGITRTDLTTRLDLILAAMAEGPISATQLADWVEDKPSRVRHMIARLRARKAIDAIEVDGDLCLDFRGAMFIVLRLNTPIANQLAVRMADTLDGLRSGKLKKLRGPQVDASALNASLHDLLPELFPREPR